MPAALRVLEGPHAPQTIAVPPAVRYILLGRRCKAPAALAGAPGLLHVTLKRVVPEALKPRRIAIGGAAPRVIESQAA